MSAPYVICHMMSSVDGKILSENWNDEFLTETYAGVFEKYHNEFESEAWMCGRITMEKDFSDGVKPGSEKPTTPISREYSIGNDKAESFAIAIDPDGKLGWNTNETGGDHIIEVLAEKVGNDYLGYLQSKNISYIIAGKDKIDFAKALTMLGELFPIKTLMLEGGGHINGSMLNEGLIDELSLLILPIADGTPKSPTTFEVSEYLTKKPASHLKLIKVSQLENDVIWTRYQVQK
ncbi:MAG: dihydrofolate reductase family protein [Flavitalea sp.]